jgi:hypothetical protein
MTTSKNSSGSKNGIIIESPKDYVSISLPEKLRDDVWIERIGQIQTEIDKFRLRSPAGKVLIDFRATRWIDPFPLMSLLLEIHHAISIGFTIKLFFPNSDDGPKPYETGPYQKSPNRLLRFLSKEGFFQCIDKLLQSNKIELSPPETAEWKTYQNLHVTASYEDAHCIPIELIDAPPPSNEPDFAKEIVDTKLKGLESKLKSRIAPHLLERLTYKLRIALQELLTNSQEHAYIETDAHRFVCLYVRYRSGKIGLDSTAKDSYKESAKYESRHCTRLDKSWLDTRPGCLEVFILDRGNGMVSNFENTIKTDGWDKWKFAEALHTTFFKGESTKEKRQTRYGGLHLIHNILKSTGDYIRAIEGDLWFGKGVPLTRHDSQHRAIVNCQTPIKGLGFHLRLGWKEDTDLTDRWATFRKHKQSEIWPELELTPSQCISTSQWLDKQQVFDERFDEIIHEGEGGDWFLWLVPPHLSKSDIINRLQHTIAPKVKSDSTLIIADIPSYEAETYAEALANYKSPTTWPTQFSKIILCTNKLRFAVVTFKEHISEHDEHSEIYDGFSDIHTDIATVEISLPTVSPKPAHIRLFILRWLKWHDSKIVWGEIENTRDKLFISEKIIWEKEGKDITKTINGYLNFAHTTHNKRCSQVYQAALTRILGVVPPTEATWFSLDRLLSTLLRSVRKSEEFEQKINAKTKFSVGSVLVSGSTLQSSPDHILNIHFFIHSDSPSIGKSPSILHWLPQSSIVNTDARFERIGKTASIALEGWKSFEVPRFDSTAKQVGERSPHKTFEDWQSPSPVIVKSGHWSYEGHHDFITINIPNAVDAAFMGKTKLVRFLVNKILKFIGIGKKDIDVSWHHILPEDYPDKSKPLGGIVVYRSHPSSDTVIRNLLGILTPPGREKAWVDIFPIQPVRMRVSGSTFLIPPLEQQEFKRALLKGGRARDVMLFDDAAITGRTLTDLQTKLNSLGASPLTMRMVVITNRLRHPTDGHNYPKIEYFWRLDIPIMGREGSCPFCHALHLIDAFSNSLAATNAKNEIHNWKAMWSSTSPSDNWSAGLQPIPLRKPERKKPYCYRINSSKDVEQNFQAEIDITRSTGRVIHISELYAMTGRDDYSIKKIADHNEPEIKVEIAASQLFIYGNELDQKIRFDLLKALMQSLAHLKSDSSHASLASLAIVGNFNLLSEINKKDLASIVETSEWRNRSNYCTKIILAYLVSENQLLPSSYPYKVGKSILSTASWPIGRKLNDWFLGTKSPRGNSHSEAIPLLVDRLNNGFKTKWLEHRDAIDSLDHFQDILDGLSRGLVRKDVTAKFKNLTLEIETTIASAKHLLIKKEKTKSDYNSILLSLESFITQTKKVANGFFHIIHRPTEYHNEQSFEKVLEILVSSINWENAFSGKTTCERRVEQCSIEISATGREDFDRFAREVWILWHRNTTWVVRDLLKNAVYAIDTITDPWDSESERVADLWLQVNYSKHFVQIVFANKANPISRPSFSKLKSHRWDQLIELGGMVEKYDHEDLSIFGISVQIPYAGHIIKESTNAS